MPLSVELRLLDIYSGKRIVGYFGARGISISIELGVDCESFFHRGVADQVEHHFMTHQRTPPPVLCDMGKHSVLDLVASRPIAS
jgi:hypothetical protein